VTSERIGTDPEKVAAIAELEWTPEHQMAFKEVKARLVADPVLACPNFSRTFNLQTDGEGVLGDRLGDPEAQAISGRLPL